MNFRNLFYNLALELPEFRLQICVNICSKILRRDWLQAGHTGLSIAEQLGYLSVVEILDKVTSAVVSAALKGSKYKPVAPERMQEASMMELDRNSQLLGFC